MILATRRFVAFAVLSLLGLQYWMAVGSKLNHSTTSDELAHLTGGYSYWKFRDYRLHPENGILPQRWAALPAWLGGAHPPSIKSEEWRKSDVWMVGYDFFYNQGNDHERWLLAGRAMIALFASATGLLVFIWSRHLWGTIGGLLSLGFYAFSPTVLAHGALITSDMCMAFFFLAAVGAYWKHLHSANPRDWILSACMFGLACVAKFSAVLLLPMMAAMALARAWHPDVLRFRGRTLASRPGKLAAITLSTVGQGLVAIVIIWAFYGFRYQAFNPDLPAAEHFIRPWEWVRFNIGAQGKIVDLAASLKLLPEGFLYGYAYTIESVIARGAFLDGEYSIHGWVSFFPKAFLYKTPLPLLLALAAAAILTGLKWRALAAPRFKTVSRHLYRLIPLLVLISVYWLFSLTTNLNIGHRHILPTYPVLFILVGLLGQAATQAFAHRRRSGFALAILILGLWGTFCFDSWRIRPYYIAYFNQIAGGPENGYKHLVDSSLDWGQDLPSLKLWLDTHRRPKEPLYLSYFGTSIPDFYRIKAIMMPTINDFGKPRPWYWCEPGLYAISATMLQHVYMPQRGEWTEQNEREYQELKLNEPNFRALKASPYGHPELMRDVTPIQWGIAWSRFEQLRFTRLCQYLRARQPDAMIGYSILVFRLDQAELDAAIGGNFSELAAAANHTLEKQKVPSPK